MAYVAMNPTKPSLKESEEQIHKIRITLSNTSAVFPTTAVVCPFFWAFLIAVA